MEQMLDALKWSVVIGGAAALLTLLKPLLDRRYSPRWRYGVWLVMAALLLLAPVRWERLAPRLPAAEPPVVIQVPRMELSVSREAGVSLQRPEPAAGTSADPGGAAPEPAAGRTLKLDALLPLAWLAGGAAFALYRLLGTAVFLRRARRWSRGAGEETCRLYGQICREMGIRRPPELRVSSAVDSPMLAGLLRPRLLLPGEDYQDWELPFILRHELTHYRRRDLWYKLLLLAACAVHWFNPLVHLLRREAEADLELTCDGLVVAGADGAARRAYSEALLSSVRRQQGLSRWVLSTHFYGGAEVMKERFRNILGKGGRRWGAAALALTLLATLAAACAFGIRQEGGSALSQEELAQWQERVESPEMDRYIHRMYTDVSLLPAEETLDEIFPAPEGAEHLGYEDVNPRVLSGTKDGDTVTLEVEGHFASRLPSGTLTLVDGEPVSFTTPLYTAAEAAAKECMDRAGEIIASYTDDPPVFEEKVITNLFCAETVTAGEKTYYVWNLYYGMRPDDISKVMFAGGMDGENGWVNQSSSMGDPVLILSVDGDGGIALEAETWTGTLSEEGLTWEEYVVCGVHLGMEPMYGILNGWPRIETDFLTSMRDGHETWAMDWQDVTRTYLSRQYGVEADGGLASLRTFQADSGTQSHDQAMVVKAVCGASTAYLLLAHVRYYVPAWDTDMTFWQVCGVKWEPGAPAEAVLGRGEPFSIEDLAVEVTNVVATRQEVMLDDGGNEHAYTCFTCAPGAMVKVTNVSEEGGRSGWAFDIAGERLDVAMGMDPVAVTEDVAGIYDTEASLYVLRFEMAEELTPAGQPGAALTADELATLTSYFNTVPHNGLLRMAYESFGDLRHYQELLFYDLGTAVTDQAERAALENRVGGYFDTDCFKLTRTFIRDYYAQNFDWEISDADMERMLGEDLSLPNLQEYDAWYLIHGDTMLTGYEFTGGTWAEDGTVRLYYTTDLWQYNEETSEMDLLWDQPMTAHLRPRPGGGVRMISNTPGN